MTEVTPMRYYYEVGLFQYFLPALFGGNYFDSNMTVKRWKVYFRLQMTKHSNHPLLEM